MKKRTKKAKTNSRGNVIRLGRVNIHLTNRWLYTFIALGILVIIGVGVWAAIYPASGAGHPYTEISTCGANKILKMNTAGTAWICGDDVDTKCSTSGACSQVCIGTDCRTSWPSGSISTNPLYVEGAITAPEGTLRDDNGGWVRTYGATGWYSQTYDGGWYMTDTTWLRAYNNKNIYTGGSIQADGNINYGYQIVTASGGASCKATCPSGKKVTGGGCSGGVDVYNTYPSGDNAWYCKSSSGTVTCYAICARVAA